MGLTQSTRPNAYTHLRNLPKAKDLNSKIMRFNLHVSMICGEIFYNIRLLRINAPWIGKIYLITDNQRPEWLGSTEERQFGVQLVSHEEIFHGYTHFLPTFNSTSIETALHRIDGLSDRFIYLNDDFFITHPTKEEDYFRGDQPLFRGWVRKRRYRSLLEKAFFENLVSPRRVYPDESHHEGMIANRMGSEKIFRGRKHIVNLFHAPSPIVRNSYAEIMESRIDHNARFKFRSPKQFRPLSLYAKYSFPERAMRYCFSRYCLFSP